MSDQKYDIKDFLAVAGDGVPSAVTDAVNRFVWEQVPSGQQLPAMLKISLLPEAKDAMDAAEDTKEKLTSLGFMLKLIESIEKSGTRPAPRGGSTGPTDINDLI